MIKVTFIHLYVFLGILSCKAQDNKKNTDQLIEVKHSKSVITIDGKANESIWKTASWHPIDQLWLGAHHSDEDFSGRFKLAWTEEALYVLAEITDDTLFDQHNDPLKLWWDDDCLEVFIDEDNSGGNHQYNHNAFAYHIALDGNVVDMSTKESGILFNNHAESNRTTEGNITVWEVKFLLFDISFDEDHENNVAVGLSEGKKIGFAIAYCDNDGSLERENFIGSIPVEGSDKNRGWIDANIFGTLILVN